MSFPQYDFSEFFLGLHVLFKGGEYVRTNAPGQVPLDKVPPDRCPLGQVPSRTNAPLS